MFSIGIYDAFYKIYISRSLRNQLQPSALAPGCFCWPPADKLACTTTDDGNSANDRQVVGCNWLSTPAAGARDAASASAAESRP